MILRWLLLAGDVNTLAVAAQHDAPTVHCGPSEHAHADMRVQDALPRTVQKDSQISVIPEQPEGVALLRRHPQFAAEECRAE